MVSNVCPAPPDGVVSELHLVDLIGSQSMAGGGMGVTPGGVGVGGAGAAWERERRAAAVQLLAFTRVVDHLAKRGTPPPPEEAGGGDGAVKLLSARDSRLTQAGPARYCPPRHQHTFLTLVS